MADPNDTRAELEAKIQEYAGTSAGEPLAARDEVNTAMINQWCDALGDRNPVYTDAEAAAASVHGGIVAPPTMLQAWILQGIEMANPDMEGDRQRELMALFQSYGYTGVVATNCDQTYRRYLAPGDRVTGTTTFESVSDQKATALGTGYFVTTRTVFHDQDGEDVGEMTFRVLYFKPNAPAADDGAAAGGGMSGKPKRLRPALGHDNRWWWDAVAGGKVLIQKCSACGVLRHPPRPMCGECQSLEWETVETTGRGEVHSYVVMHHPQVPGYEYPLAVAVVDLEEGTRLVANVVGCDPKDVHIGMKVETRVEEADEGLSLPFFYPAG